MKTADHNRIVVNILLCTLFLVLLSATYLSTAAAILKDLQNLGVPVGGVTVTIQSLLLCLSLIIFLNSKRKNEIIKETLITILIWVPFLSYIYLRTDFSDPYSAKKFGLMIGMGFLPVLCICVCYIHDPKTFDRLFAPVSILLVLLLLSLFIANPKSWYYSDSVKRLQLESLSSIWLARSFAIGAICCLLIIRQPGVLNYLGFAVFLAAIIPTGSRAPALTTVITGFLFWAKGHIQSARRILIGFLTCCLLIPILLVAWTQYSTRIEKYVYRGTQQGLMEESGRLAGIQAAFRKFIGSPFFGKGFGKYGDEFGESSFFQKNISGKLHVVYPHNVPLELLAELGTIGFVFFIAALRPGYWMLKFQNGYAFLFFAALFFSCASGDITGNTSLFVFGTLSKLATKQDDSITV